MTTLTPKPLVGLPRSFASITRQGQPHIDIRRVYVPPPEAVPCGLPSSTFPILFVVLLPPLPLLDFSRGRFSATHIYGGIWKLDCGTPAAVYAVGRNMYVSERMIGRLQAGLGCQWIAGLGREEDEADVSDRPDGAKEASRHKAFLRTPDGRDALLPQCGAGVIGGFEDLDQFGGRQRWHATIIPCKRLGGRANY
jgi:hypothetical protein